MTEQHLNWIPLKDWSEASQAKRVAEIWRTPHLAQVVRALLELGIGCHLVGGIVRDLLLDRPGKDLDLVLSCSAGELFKCAYSLRRRTGASLVPLDRTRGILRLCFSGDEELDLVVRQADTLNLDLLRRDLTINALALDPNGNMADPSGGLNDLRKGVIRAVLPQNFHHDPLRVLRALRFAAQLDFEYEPATWALMNEAGSKLTDVAGERLTSELKKFFAAARSRHLKSLIQLEIPQKLFGIASPVEQNGSLLLEIGEKEPVGFERGLALLLEGYSEEMVAERLRLSNRTKKFLAGWWAGARRIRSKDSLSCQGIVQLKRVSGPAFLALAETVPFQKFSCRLSDEERVRLMTEARQQGVIDWTPVPWSGTEIAAVVGKKPGPWLSEAIRRVEEQWACGRCRRLGDVPALLEKDL